MACRTAFQEVVQDGKTTHVFLNDAEVDDLACLKKLKETIARFVNVSWADFSRRWFPKWCRNKKDSLPRVTESKMAAIRQQLGISLTPQTLTELLPSLAVDLGLPPTAFDEFLVRRQAQNPESVPTPPPPTPVSSPSPPSAALVHDGTEDVVMTLVEEKKQPPKRNVSLHGSEHPSKRQKGAGGVERRRWVVFYVTCPVDAGFIEYLAQKYGDQIKILLIVYTGNYNMNTEDEKGQTLGKSMRGLTRMPNVCVFHLSGFTTFPGLWRRVRNLKWILTHRVKLPKETENLVKIFNVNLIDPRRVYNYPVNYDGSFVHPESETEMKTPAFRALMDMHRTLLDHHDTWSSQERDAYLVQMRRAVIKYVDDKKYAPAWVEGKEDPIDWAKRVGAAMEAKGVVVGKPRDFKIGIFDQLNRDAPAADLCVPIAVRSCLYGPPPGVSDSLRWGTWHFDGKHPRFVPSSDGKDIEFVITGNEDAVQELFVDVAQCLSANDASLDV